MTRRLALAAACSLALAVVSGLRAQPARPERSAVPPKEHWSFQLLRRPDVPAVGDRAWVRTPIDAFVLARLEKAGLKPSPTADRRTLLRRVTLDLIGLPPTPEEQRAFLADDSPDAFARVVDDLLARPQYGERWGRHWLDVARYAETNGYERDGAKPSAWRFRDYVIDSFNGDKPYDRFVLEQIAGDEVEGSNAETQIATTFLRLGTWDDEPADPKIDRYDQLDDVLGTTATAFLGLTLRCARCHDHKFEPFPQTDYYKMLSVFEPLKRPQKDRADLDVSVGSAEELAAFRANPKAAPHAYVWKEEGPKAPVTHVLRRRPEPAAPGSRPRSARRPGAARAGPAPPHGKIDGPAPVAGAVADQRRQPADGARDGQPRLAVALRPRAGADGQRLRHRRRAADAPRAARLAGGALRRRRLAPETAAPANRPLRRVSDLGGGAGRGGPRRPQRRAAGALAAAAAGGGGGARRDAGGERAAEPGAARAEYLPGAGAGGAGGAVAARRRLGQVGRAPAGPP